MRRVACTRLTKDVQVLDFSRGAKDTFSESPQPLGGRAHLLGIVRWRRLVRDFEQRADLSEAMIHIAMSGLLLRRIAHPRMSKRALSSARRARVLCVHDASAVDLMAAPASSIEDRPALLRRQQIGGARGEDGTVDNLGWWLRRATLLCSGRVRCAALKLAELKGRWQASDLAAASSYMRTRLFSSIELSSALRSLIARSQPASVSRNDSHLSGCWVTKPDCESR